MLVALAIVLTAIGLIHAYLWRRLVWAVTTPGSRARRVGTAVVVVLVVALLVAMVGGQVLTDRSSKVITWPGYVWLAALFYLLLLLLVSELPIAVTRLVLRRTSPSEEVNQQRRRLLSGSVAAVAGVATTGALGYGVAMALSTPRRTQVRIPLATWPTRLDGFRIALLSDLHLGPFLGATHAQRVVDIVNDYDADLVAVVGDLVDGTVDELRADIEPLGNLRSALGTYVVTGNHEYYTGDAEAWVDHFRTLGMRPLRNELVHLDGVDVAGVNDATAASRGGQGPDYDSAIADRDPSVPAILLAHQPVQAFEAARRGFDLQLSGHTHGGQMWPFSLAVGLQQPVTSGLGTVDGLPVFVTRGAGFWGPPVRVGAPPEVPLIELRSL